MKLLNSRIVFLLSDGLKKKLKRKVKSDGITIPILLRHVIKEYVEGRYKVEVG